MLHPADSSKGGCDDISPLKNPSRAEKAPILLISRQPEITFSIHQLFALTGGQVLNHKDGSAIPRVRGPYHFDPMGDID